MWLQNVFEDLKRYPEITIEQLVAANPQLILLSSEPYPFKEKHIEELKTVFQQHKNYLVDGEMFSWYGSRMISAPELFLFLIKTIEL
jgi:ABC-type Fe3+-hydroxamate transport system substrate-binding protein